MAAKTATLASPVCVRCGAADALVTVDLTADFGPDDEVFHCHGCDSDFSLADVEAVLASWAGWLPWLRQHPGYTPAE